MHALHIQNEHVRTNVAFVVETIRQQRKAVDARQQSLDFVLDRRTGLFHSPQTTVREKDHLCIVLHLHIDGHEVHITKKNHPAIPFNLKKLSKKGQQVVSETIHSLKTALSHVHAIRELAHLELEPSMTAIQERGGSPLECSP